jgi:hypothetical protein
VGVAPGSGVAPSEGVGGATGAGPTGTGAMGLREGAATGVSAGVGSEGDPSGTFRKQPPAARPTSRPTGSARDHVLMSDPQKYEYDLKIVALFALQIVKNTCSLEKSRERRKPLDKQPAVR